MFPSVLTQDFVDDMTQRVEHRQVGTYFPVSAAAASSHLFSLPVPSPSPSSSTHPHILFFSFETYVHDPRGLHFER